MPLFVFPENMPLLVSSLICLQATAGDAIILLLMYWMLVLSTKSRRWIYDLNPLRVTGFLALGIILTIIIEAASTSFLDRWTYGELMPTLPVLGTGLAPVLQWLIIPLLVLVLLRRRKDLL